MSAQHPNILERLFGWKREPERTPWTRFREEHPVLLQTPLPVPQSTPPGGIMRVNPIRLKGYVRNQIEEMRMRMVVVHPPQYLLPPPMPRQQTGAMRPVSEPLPSALLYANEPVRPVQHIERAQMERTTLREGEDEMPAWARPEPPAQHTGEIIKDEQGWHVTVRRDELFSDVEPSQPLEDDDNAPTEMTPRAKFQRAINGLLGKEESA